MDPRPTFILNGRAVALDGCAPRESLLRWLQRNGLSGTKEGCGDGDCGACTVALVERDPEGLARYEAVNSCLLPLGQVVGRELLTVEALADGARLHPAQQVLVDSAGSQCGYCTPGFVMSLFVGQQNGELDDATTEGNLCRCTGYRPIRAATVALREQPVHPPAIAHVVAASAALPRFAAPTTLADALAMRAAEPAAQWISGATDLGVDFSRRRPGAAAHIALDRIAELQALDIADDHVRIGAGVSLTRLERELHGLFPSLDALLHLFAARQVKNRATLGGNLGSASPIGDLLPWLLALDATIELAGPAGRRELPADGYFVDYRRTQRRDDELVVAARVPRAAVIDAGYKVAKRQTDDISIVAAVFALAIDGERRVMHARLAYGGVAAVPLRARATEDWLLGRTLDAATVTQAQQRLQQEFTPLSDHRASADYRRALAGNLFTRFVRERLP